MSLTIDASVWIAAADAGDVFHAASRDFLRRVVADRLLAARRVSGIASGGEAREVAGGRNDMRSWIADGR